MGRLPHGVPGQRCGKCPHRTSHWKGKRHTRPGLHPREETLSLTRWPSFQTGNRRSEARIGFLSTVASVAEPGLELGCLLPSLWLCPAASEGSTGQVGGTLCPEVGRKGKLGKAERCYPKPFPPAGPEQSPAPVWISAGANHPPRPSLLLRPVPFCPVQIHPQTCAQQARMRQWLPDVEADA